jgi:hypothetical protein
MTGWWVGCMRLLGGSRDCPNTTLPNAIAFDRLRTLGSTTYDYATSNLDK